MTAIDEMDIIGFWKVRSWAENHRKDKNGKKNRKTADGDSYIDDVLPFL